MKRLIFSLLLVSLLAACAPKTTVVLLPDDQGTVGKVTVRNAKGAHTLSAANETVQVDDAISTPRTMPQAELEKTFGRTLSVMPQAAQSFMLYFATASTEPDATSRTELPAIIAAIQGRTAPNVSIIGHSDAAGNPEKNQKLSLARALVVQKLLGDRSIPANIMAISAHGANDPLVPTPAGVPEARNRRVEVLVR